MADALVHERIYRGEAVMAKMAAMQITVCGGGAVGSNLVENLSRQGFKALTVIDDDRVEPHNIPTQVWSRREIGLYKAAALKNIVFNICGGAVQTVTSRLEAGNIKKHLASARLVVDGFDNSDSRRLVHDYCKAEKKPCLHVGLAKDYAEVIWNESYHVPRDVVGQDVCEYPMARNTILLAVAVASDVIVRYVATGSRQNYMITLGDFKIERVITL